MSDLLITTLVSGKTYLDYIPVYVHSILKAYPCYDVKMLTPGGGDTSKIEDILKAYGYDGCLRKVKLPRHLLHKPRYLRSARWLLPRQFFAGYRYAYIGDVDFVILSEPTPLRLYHIDHMQKTGLPYSNDRRDGKDRLTGLHFIDVEGWYQAIEDERQSILAGLPDTVATKRNETLLYEMVCNAGIPPVQDGWHRRWHGIHLGVMRRSKRKQKQVIREYVNDAMAAQYVMMYESDKKLNAILKDVGGHVRRQCKGVYEILKGGV